MKRESGVSPGRSGHCERGAKRISPLYKRLYEKERRTKIRESGNLLG